MNHSTSSHKEALAEVRRVVAEATELSREADGALTDHLATWIAGRYAMATHQLVLENGNGGVDWNLLRAMCQDMVALRRGDHSAESLRLERDRLEMDRAKQKEEMERRFWAWAKEKRGKICQDSLTPEQREQAMRRILGVDSREETAQAEGNCPAPEAQADQGQ